MPETLVQLQTPTIIELLSIHITSPSDNWSLTLQGIKNWTVGRPRNEAIRTQDASRKSRQNLLAYRARGGTLSAAGPYPLWAFTRLKTVANRMDVKINSAINMAAMIFPRTKLRSAIKKQHRTRAIKFTVAMQFFAWKFFYFYFWIKRKSAKGDPTKLQSS